MHCRQAHLRKYRQDTEASPGRQRITVLSHKTRSLSPESKELSILNWKRLISSAQNSSFTQKVPNQVRCLATTADLFLTLSVFPCWKRRPQAPGVRLRLCCRLATRGSCPRGLHLLASGVAVSWVPKTALLHLLVQFKISSDFVSFLLVPIHDNA